MADFATLIQDWYRLNKRSLPWRENKNPYFIWLSEVMLQQTRVDQATSYFLKFKHVFPSVCDLANANENHVLNNWQGLGYYSRARNLHAAAITICNEFNGEFPNDYNTIKSLKGIGDYTAAAIASIAFELPYAVVDGNVYRVLSRYFDISTPIDSTMGKKEFATLAQELLDKKSPGDYNQALMEFGAIQCIPKNPNCAICPLRDSCLGYANKSYLDLPVKSKKTKVKNRYIDYFVITDGKQVFINKREKEDIWKGLYDFPSRDSFEKEKELPSLIEKLNPTRYYLDKSRKHILSHQKIEGNFYIVEVPQIPDLNYDLIPLNEITNYPLPQLLVKYLETSDFFNNL